jgi:hypothetical protein
VTRLPMIYIAGPITHPDPLANTGEGMRWFDELTDTGLCVCFLPHLSSFLHMRRPRGHAEWLAMDKQYILRCDALFRLPGESVGADIEVAFCTEHKVPVFEERSALLDWCRDWIEAHRAE